MTKHQRPNLVYDFAGFSARAPNQQIPGDRLAAQFAEHAGAIVKLQLALELLDKPLTADDIDPKLIRQIAAEAKVSLEQLSSDAARAAGRAASAAQHAANAAGAAEQASAPVLARAEALLAAEREALRQLEAHQQLLYQLERRVEDLSQRPALREPTDPVGVLGPNAGGKHSADKAGATATAADYADVATHWAEWMGPGGLGAGGPAGASDIIPANILAINAISGDHWSSRWWAHRAAAAVGGQLAYLYLGPYPTPPLTTPDGGQIPIGAIYWNTTTGQMYVWNGTTWLPFSSPTKAYTSSLFYTATAGQTVFDLGVADMFGSSHVLKADGSEGTEVYFNGVRLTPVDDYTIDPVANTVTLANPAPAGSIVGVDVMTDPKALAPILALTAKLLPLPFDGVTTAFPLSGATNVTVVPVADASALLVVIDGVEQEPGVDFTLNATGDGIIFAEAPAADAKSFIIAFLRSGLGFLTRVEHDNTLTGEGTTILPLGAVSASANPGQRGVVYVPGLAGATPNHLTINALTGELGATTAVQTQVQAGTDAIQPLTSANLRAVNGLPVSSLTTVQKTVVPAINELKAGQLYKGVWQVAANSPNLTPPLVPPAANGWTWTAQTANPNTPEVAPAGLTGIAGQSIRSGDEIVWTGAQYQNISAAYVLKVGDSMTGELRLPIGPPSANDVATNKLYVDTAIASNALYRGPWQVAANNPDLVAAVATNLNGWSWIAETVSPLVPEFAPAGMPGIGGQQVDTGDRVIFSSTGPTYQLIKGSSLSIVEGDARYLNTAGDTATGPIILAADPTVALGAVTKQYVDANDLLNVKKAGDTMTGELLVVDPPVDPLAAVSKTYADTTFVDVAGDTMTGRLTLSADPALPLEAVTKQYSDLKVLKTGDVMTGQLTLPATAPVGNQDAATKIYVDTAIATGNLYQGQWQVAANLPDLTPPMTPPALNGYSWIAQTVDPNIPEVVPAGLPGIAGLTIFNGDTIRWNAGTSQYERFQGSSLTIAQADTLYVKQVGDTMTGPLVLNADPTLPAGAATKNYVDVLTAAKVDKAGDTMTGMLTLPITHPTLPEEAANKDYVDFAVATNSLYQGAYTVATNTPDLTAVTPLNGYSWITQTADPQVPEPTIVALPGIPLGTVVDAGWTIKYNGGTAQFELIKGPDISLTTASTLFVDVTGDTMTGELNMATDGTGVTFNGGGRLYKLAGGGMIFQESAGGQQPQIADNNGANRRDIIDTINGDARYLNTAGDTTTGVLNIGAATGLNFITQQAANPGDNSKHIQLYSTAPAIGINVTSGRINYNHNAAADAHWFRTGNADRLGISNTINFNGTPVSGFTATGQVNVNANLVIGAAGVLYVYAPNSTNNTTSEVVEFRTSDGRATSALYAVKFGLTAGQNEGGIAAAHTIGGWGGLSQVWTTNLDGGGNHTQFYVNNVCSAQSYTTRSDARLKDDIRYDIREAVQAFDALKPTVYRNKPVTPHPEATWPEPEEKLRFGFVADDMFKDPLLARVGHEPYDKEGMRGYDIVQVLTLAVAKIKALEHEIEELKKGRPH